MCTSFMFLAPSVRIGAHRILALASVLAMITSCGGPSPVPPESHAGHQTPAPSVASVGVTSDAVRINTTAAPGAPPKGMVWIPGGTFWMGCEDCGMPDALPVHLVEVDGFWMDQAPVTNAEFER